MVPPVTVKPPAERPMESAVVSLSVSVPPLVSELFPSKPSPPEVPTVRDPSLVTLGLLPLLPIVMLPSSATLPVDEIVRPVPSTFIVANDVPDTPRTREPSTVVGPFTVRLRPFDPPLVPMVSVAPWATSSPDSLGDTLESTTVASAVMHTFVPVGTAAGLQLVAVFQSVVPAPPVHDAEQVRADAGGAVARAMTPTAPKLVTTPATSAREAIPDVKRLDRPLCILFPLCLRQTTR